MRARATSLRGPQEPPSVGQHLVHLAEVLEAPRIILRHNHSLEGLLGRGGREGRSDVPDVRRRQGPRGLLREGLVAASPNLSEVLGHGRVVGLDCLVHLIPEGLGLISGRATRLEGQGGPHHSSRCPAMRAQVCIHVGLSACALVAELVGRVRRVAMMPHPTLHPARRRELELRGARGPPPARGAQVLIDAQRGAVEAAHALRLSSWMARRDSDLFLFEGLRRGLRSLRRCFRLRDGQRLLQRGPIMTRRDRRYCAGHAAEPSFDAPLWWHHVARAAEGTPAPDHGSEEVREGRTRGRWGTLLIPDDLSQNGDECERGRGTESLRARADGDECERGRGSEGQS